MENFGKKFGNKLRTAVALGAAAAFSGGALEASQFDIAKAQTAVTMAELKLKNANSPKDKIKAEEILTLAKARVEEARAKDADEQENSAKSAVTPNSRDISKIGVASKNEAKTTVTMEEVDILDANGKKIGSAMSGSEAWKKLKERESKDNRAIEKEKAKQNRPIIVNPNDGYGNVDANNPAIDPTVIDRNEHRKQREGLPYQYHPQQ